MFKKDLIIDFELIDPETREVVSVSVNMREYIFVPPEKHYEWLLNRYKEKLIIESILNNLNNLNN